MSRCPAILLSLCCVSGVWTRPVEAQMIHTATPFQSIGSSYWHGGSVGWSLRGPGWFANLGGQGPLLPPFGGADPGAGLSGGFAFGGGGVSGNLSFNFAQGSSRSVVSTTPSVTTMNGVPGSITSGVVRPFVTGFTPVVSDYVEARAPMDTAAQAGSQIAQQQITTLRRSQAALNNRKLDQYLRRIERAESEGNKRMARANYRSAIAIAPEPLRSQLQSRLKALMQTKPANR